MKQFVCSAVCLWLFMSVFFMPYFAVAQETQLEPIVVTATKTPKKIENIPAVVTVISQEEMKTTPARTIGDLLANLPGVYSHEPQGEGLVTPQSLTISGNGFPGHTLILVDGQRINTPFTDYAYLTTVPVRAVDRIEVIRGNFSALYGSSAGGGIINIITKDGGKTSYVSPWGQAGNFGRTEYGLDAGIAWKQFSLGLFYDCKEVDNYYLYDDKDLDDRNRDYDHNRFHGKLTGTIGDLTRFSLSGGIADGDTGNGIGNNLGIDQHQEARHSYLNFQSESSLTEKLDIRAQLDWFRSDHDYYGETLTRVSFMNVGQPTAPVMVPRFTYQSSINDTSTDRWRGDLSANYFFTENQILTAGTEVVYTSAEKAIKDVNTGQLLEVQGRPGQSADVDDTLYSFYAQYDHTFMDVFELVLGGRLDDYETYGSEFSPKATVRWNYADGGNLKISAGRGFKAPNLNHLYSPPWSISPFIVYQGNPDLKAETLWSYELSAEQYAMDKKLFFRITPYYTDAEDFITSVRHPDPLNPGGQIMQPENVEEVDIRGVDVEVSYTALPGLTFFVNCNYNETRDDNTDEILDGYPRNSASLGVRGYHRIHEDWNLSGSYAARYRGKYDTTSWGNPPVTETVGDYWYHTSRIGLSWKNMVELSFDACNLFNDRSKTDISTYVPEFNYLVGLSFRYGF